MKKLFTFGFIFMLFFPADSFAVFKWIGGTGNWDDPGHWDCACVPAAGDEVLIDAGSVDLDISPTISKLTMEGGKITAGGETLTVLSSFIWKEGEVAAKILMAGGTLDMGSLFTKTLTGEIELSSGTSGAWSAGPFVFKGGLLDIKDMATFDIVGDETISDGGGGGAIEIAGGLVKSLGTGRAHIHVEIINKATGTLDLETGHLDLHKKLTNLGIIELGVLDTITCHDDFHFDGGSIEGPGWVTVKGKIIWDAGEIASGPNLVCEAGGTMTIAGHADKSIHGSLHIFGDAEWTDKHITMHGGSAEIVVETGGTFELKWDGNIEEGTGGKGSLKVEGTFSKTASSAGKESNIVAEVENTGTFNVMDTIDIKGFLQNEGTLHVPATAYLRVFEGGRLDPGTGLTGVGDIDFLGSSSTYTFATPVSCSNNIGFIASLIKLDADFTNDNIVWILSGAEITDPMGGELVLSGTGVLKFRRGTLTADATIMGTATAEFSHTSDTKIIEGSFTNRGTATIFADVDVNLDAPGTVTNEGTFIFKSDADLTTTGTPGGFSNTATGTVDIQTTNTKTVFMAGDFTNAGTLIGEGLFKPNGTYTNTTTGKVSPGHSPGKLTIDNDFNNGDSLIIELFSGTTFDELVVKESVTLGGKLKVKIIGSIPVGSYAILRCEGGSPCISGTFSAIDMPGGYTVSYMDTRVLVNRSILPVELTFFRANMLGKNVELKWQTASETNHDYFQIERSFDGKNFQPIGKIYGQGDALETTDYKYMDKNIPAHFSKIYYRLRQMDFDGSENISEVRLVLFPENKFLIENISNYISGEIAVRFFSDDFLENIQFKIMDINGRPLFSKIIKGHEGTGEMYIRNLIPGTYVLSVKTGREIFNRMVVVN